MTGINSVALVAGSLLLMGCGSNNPAAIATTPSPTPASSPSVAPPTQNPRTLTFKLIACTGPAVCGNANPLNEGPSKFGQGTVRVDINADSYTITVTAKGFTPNSSHLINVHPGSCATPNLDQFDQLVVAIADAHGSLTSVTNLPGSYLVPGPGRILTVHGDDIARRQTHIACTNLTN